MNLVDALRTGKPFKRKNRLEWLDATYKYSFDKDDVLADDWVVQQFREWSVVVDHDCALVDPNRQIVSPSWEKIKVREVFE